MVLGVYTRSMETIYLSQVNTGSWGYLFHEIPCSKIYLYRTESYPFLNPTQVYQNISVPYRHLSYWVTELDLGDPRKKIAASITNLFSYFSIRLKSRSDLYILAFLKYLKTIILHNNFIIYKYYFVAFFLITLLYTMLVGDGTKRVDTFIYFDYLGLKSKKHWARREVKTCVCKENGYWRDLVVKKLTKELDFFKNSLYFFYYLVLICLPTKSSFFLVIVGN